MKHLFDNSVVLEPFKFENNKHPIGNLEMHIRELNNGAANVYPIAYYINIINKIRALSQKTKDAYDEMMVAIKLKEELKDMAVSLGLPEKHFDIDTSGDPIIIKEKNGEHLILPTHFEKGAYFSAPHADHQLYLPIEQLPRLRIGKYTRFGSGVGINTGGYVNIGNYVWFSPGSYLLMQNHRAYGRLSIASRTPSMTDLSSITVCDYAWIGKEATLGWYTDYVGKGASVAFKSTVNSIVGDYSLTGDRGRILDYFPYKAAVVENMGATLEDILKISNWSAVQQMWKEFYSDIMKQHPVKKPLRIVENALNDMRHKEALNILDLEPGIGNNLLLCSGKDIQATGMSESRENFAVILQRLKDNNQKNVRLIGDIDIDKLYLHDYGKNLLNERRIVYDLVLNTEYKKKKPLESIKKQMEGAIKLTRINGEIILGVHYDTDTDSILEFARDADTDLISHGTDTDEESVKARVMRFRINENTIRKLED